MLEFCYAQLRSFVCEDVPTVLQLLGKSLSSANLPVKLGGWAELSPEGWLRLAPLLAALSVTLSLPFLLLHHTRAKPASAVVPPSNTYWLARVLVLRFMGVVYLAAFATSAFQGRALFGSKGLSPISWPSGRPTPVFTFLEDQLQLPFNDAILELVSWVGVLLSLLLASSTVTTFLLPLGLWLLYLSLVNLGGMIMNYGWEWLTLELGFLAIFLCPIWSRSPFPHAVPPPRLVLWLFRWCAFRLLIGAGMSKLGRNSSDCWTDLTCTFTHYETQPMPNPLGWFAHHAPPDFHKMEVAITFFEQLVLPFLMLLPIRSVRIFSGLAEIVFQLAVVGTGNYAWINFVGVLPCLVLFDDAFLAPFFGKQMASEARVAATAAAEDDRSVLQQRPATSSSAVPDSLTYSLLLRPLRRGYQYVRYAMYLGLVCFIAKKSVSPIKELFTPAPWLHFYDEYFFVNSQGVFGFINQQQNVLVLEYTHDDVGEAHTSAGSSARIPRRRPLPEEKVGQ
jgi:hypothetical protein